MPALSRREELKLANSKKYQKEVAPSIVDDVIIDNSKEDANVKNPEPVTLIEKPKEVPATKPAKSKTVASQPSDHASKPDIIRIKPPVKKQTKSIRKCFLITPEMDDKLKKMAEEYDTSENEIINQILAQVL